MYLGTYSKYDISHITGALFMDCVAMLCSKGFRNQQKGSKTQEQT